MLRWLAGLLSIIMLEGASEAYAGWCEDPANGTRACDTLDYGCPMVTNSPGQNSGEFHADYASQVETENYLEFLDSPSFDRNGYMSRIDLGTSLEMFYSYETDWLKSDIFRVAEMVAVRITEHADSAAIDRPKILLLAGTHSNEWIAQEVLLQLVDWLVQSANGNPGYGDFQGEVQDLLNQVEIWAVIQVSPGGRLYDEHIGNA
jgi:hypothetical protein